MNKWRELISKHRGKVAAIFCCIFLCLIFLVFGEEKTQDDSFLHLDETPPLNIQKARWEAAKPLMGISDAPLREMPLKPVKKHKIRTQAIKYNAPQIIARPRGQLPVGSKITARLLTSLDTRYPTKMVKVVLPVEVSFNAQVALPAQTVLLGRMSYKGSGQWIELHFDRGLSPNGEEFGFTGHALVQGTLRSGARGRIAKSMGMAAVSNMASVLTQKEALGRGRGTVINPKSTLANALIYATGKAASTEAQRQVERIGDNTDYVTLEVGTPLVIHLNKTLKGDLQ